MLLGAEVVSQLGVFGASEAQDQRLRELLATRLTKAEERASGRLLHQLSARVGLDVMSFKRPFEPLSIAFRLMKDFFLIEP